MRRANSGMSDPAVKHGKPRAGTGAGSRWKTELRPPSPPLLNRPHALALYLALSPVRESTGLGRAVAFPSIVCRMAEGQPATIQTESLLAWAAVDLTA